MVVAYTLQALPCHYLEEKLKEREKTTNAIER